MDIEQSTAVWILAPWAEFYPTRSPANSRNRSVASYKQGSPVAAYPLRIVRLARTVPVPAEDKGVPVFDPPQSIEGAVEATSPLPEFLLLETTLGLWAAIARRRGRPSLDVAFVAVCGHRSDGIEGRARESL